MNALRTVAIVAPALLPKTTAVVEAHRAIPPARRSAKLYLQAWGIAFLLFAYDAREVWNLSAWWWGSAIYLGGHLTAGDYRRVLFDAIGSALADATRLFTQARSTVEAARGALDAATKEGR